MAKLVTDDLWDRIEPLIPPEPPRPKGGRPRVPDRACLTGIVFVLKAGIPWELGADGRIDWSRASLDAGSVPAPGGASRPARTPPTAANWAASAT
jgi:transposase